MRRYLVVLAAAAVALMACGDDDDPDEGSTATESTASSGGSLPTCEAFSVEDAETLMGLELHDASPSPETVSETATSCFYSEDAAGIGDARYLAWSAILDPSAVDFDETRATEERLEPLDDDIGDDGFISVNGAHAHIDGVSIVANVYSAPGDELWEFDRDASVTVLRAIVEDVEAQS